MSASCFPGPMSGHWLHYSRVSSISLPGATVHCLDTTYPCTRTTFCFEALSLSWLLSHCTSLLFSPLFILQSMAITAAVGEPAAVSSDRRVSHHNGSQRPPSIHQCTSSLSFPARRLQPRENVEINTAAHASRTTSISCNYCHLTTTPLRKPW